MDDSKIKELFKARQGSPITKIELDTLNVALAENGAELYIDDVLQPNSPLIDGRRAHIDLNGSIKAETLTLALKFFDDFIGSAINVTDWDVIISGTPEYIVENSYIKAHRYGTYPEDEGYIDFKHKRALPSSYMLTGKFVFKDWSNPNTGINDFVLFADAGGNNEGFNEYLVMEIQTSGGTVFVKYYNKNGANYFINDIAITFGDIVEMSLVHNNVDDTIKIIILKNGIEIINQFVPLSVDKILHWQDTDQIIGGIQYYTWNASEIWIDSYKESVA